MKSVYVFSTVLIVLTIFGGQAKAQNAATSSRLKNGIIYSVGVNGVVGAGEFNDAHKWGLGGTIQADIPIAKQLYIPVESGFVNFFGRESIKNNTYYSGRDAQFLPVKTGLKYFPVGIFYVQAEAGVSFALNKRRLNYDRSAAFIYSPEVGIRLPLSQNFQLDIAGFYERSTKFKSDSKDSQVNSYGLKIAYPFTF